MLPEHLSLKLNSLLRRAGLAEVPRPVLIGVSCICVVLVIVALWRFWPASSAQSEDFSVSTDTGVEQQAVAEQGAPEESADIYVDVEGAVASPGMYVLPSDARIADAVEAAGGLTDDAARQGVNLAQKLEDGMQVYVPSADETAGFSASASSGASGTMSSAEAKINLNTASAEELQELSGIGPALSQRIIDYREEHGRFESVEELKEVSGIGDVRYEELKDAVCV